MSPLEIQQMYINGNRAKIYGLDNSPLRNKLRDYCKSLNPESMFEFGCSAGMNIFRVIGNDKPHGGIDINPVSVNYGREKLGLDISLGDEKLLDFINKKYDLVLTSSVLCHIQHNFDDIIERLKNITGKYLIMLETNDEFDVDLFAHDYSFAESKWEFLSDKAIGGNGCNYKCYQWSPS